METFKRIVLMYQASLPDSLIEYVGADRNLNLTKDGLQDYGGVRAFRALVALEWRNSHVDHARLDKLLRFLEILQEQNLILAFRKV